MPVSSRYPLKTFEDCAQKRMFCLDGEDTSGKADQSLEEFLKENPKYTQKSDNNSDNNITDGVSVKNSNNSKKDDGVTAILKQKHPELFD